MNLTHALFRLSATTGYTGALDLASRSRLVSARRSGSFPPEICRQQGHLSAARKSSFLCLRDVTDRRESSMRCEKANAR